MKRIFIVLITSLSLFCCKSNNNNYKEYSYIYYGLNCKVKSVLVKTYYANEKFGEILKGNFAIGMGMNYKAEFNSDGNIISLNNYNAKGLYDGHTEYKYNSMNNITELNRYDHKKNLRFRKTYQYNKNKIIKDISYNYNDRDTTESIQYYKDCKPHETITVSENNYNKRRYINYDYQKSEWIDYDNLNNEISKGYELYNEDGFTTEYYDGRLSRYIEYNTNKIPKYTKNVELIYNTQIGYFSRNIYNIEYEFDNKGNWIRQVVYKGENKEPYTISERVINY